MKRLVSIILITMMLLMTVYADNSVTQLITTKLGTGDVVYDFATHADGKTYVTYHKRNEIGDMYIYLGTIDNGKLNTIGEIEELIGGNNEPTTYDVAGMPQYDSQYYYVMGMVQMDGTVYIAKKRHIYKLVGNELQELELKFNGKPWDTDRLNKHTVIGKMVTNGNALFITMSALGEYITADSGNALATPLDGQVLRIDSDGNVTFTYTWLPTTGTLAGFGTQTELHEDFAVNNSEDRLVYPHRFNSQERLNTIALGETKPDVMLAGIHDPYQECHLKVLYIGDHIYSYRNRKGHIDIVDITLDKSIPYRDTRSYNAAWSCNTKVVATIEDRRYINSWSVGDDGYVYIVSLSSDLAKEQFDTIYKVKL